MKTIACTYRFERESTHCTTVCVLLLLSLKRSTVLTATATGILVLALLQAPVAAQRRYVPVDATLTGPSILAAGTTKARSLAERAAEEYDVLDFGADPTGTADSGPAFSAAAMAAGVKGISIRVPAGLYKLDIGVPSPSGVTWNVDGARLTGRSGINLNIDGSPLVGGRSFSQLRGTVAPGNEFGTYFGLAIGNGGSGASYEKDAVYIHTSTTDPSDVKYTGGFYEGIPLFDLGSTHDAVGLHSTARIAPPNQTGRAQAINAIASVDPGADGAISGLEIDVLNHGADQPYVSQPNGKGGVFLVCYGPNPCTDAIHIAGKPWHSGIIVNRSAIASGGYAFRILDNYTNVNNIAYITGEGDAKFAQLTAGSLLLTGAQSARTVMAAPADGAGSPRWRQMNFADIAGIVPITQGGTGTNNVGGARYLLGAAAAGSNADITALTAVNTLTSVAASGTNLSITYNTKGSGDHVFEANGAEVARITASGAMRLQAVTVAGLPACDIETRDMLMAVSDAVAPTWRNELNGGGRVRTLAYCDGAKWTAH